MIDYFAGVLPQLRVRVAHLLNQIPRGLPPEFHLLESVCHMKLIQIQEGFRILAEDPSFLNPANQQIRVRKYRRLIIELDSVEMIALPCLARYQDSDRFLNRVVQQIGCEIQYPLLPPVVSPFSQKYFGLHPTFNLICVPLNEGKHLLHLPDIYHELAHPLAWEKNDPRIKSYRAAILQSLELIEHWWKDQLDKANRSRGPDSYKYYYKQWQKSWEDWCIEFFCDLFAVYTLGPAFAWAHLHLCATRVSNPFDIPLRSVTTHPAADARMQVLLEGLRLIGFEPEAITIRQRWAELTTSLLAHPEPEYHLCFPEPLRKMLALNALAGIKAMDCSLMTRETTDPVRSTLNDAWVAFWSSPVQFAEKEQTLINRLKMELAFYS